MMAEERDPQSSESAIDGEQSAVSESGIVVSDDQPAVENPNCEDGGNITSDGDQGGAVSSAADITESTVPVSSDNTESIPVTADANQDTTVDSNLGAPEIGRISLTSTLERNRSTDFSDNRIPRAVDRTNSWPVIRNVECDNSDNASNADLGMPKFASVTAMDKNQNPISRFGNASNLSSRFGGFSSVDKVPEITRFGNVTTVLDSTPPERPPNPGLIVVDPIQTSTPQVSTNEQLSQGGDHRDGRKPPKISPILQSSIQNQNLVTPPRPSRGDINGYDSSPEGLGRSEMDRNGGFDFGDSSYFNMSPDESDDVLNYPASRFYKCRFCNFSATTYTQLQLHTPKHGGHLKALKCPLCDYATNDKSNFRRHRRLHIRNNPVSVLKCGKCTYSTIMPRKLREHYQQIHNEHGPATIPGENTPFPPHRFLHNGRFGLQQMDMNQNENTCPVSVNNNMSVSGSSLHSLLTNDPHHPGAYHYTPVNRQPMVTCMGNQYSAYGAMRGRQSEENHMASNYLRSIVSSIMNSQHPTRVPATSTITSTNFFMPQTVDSTHHIPSVHNTHSSHVPMDFDEDIKIKIEPIDCDGTSDVSSSATPYNSVTPDYLRHVEAQTTNADRRQPRGSQDHQEGPAMTADRNNEASTTADNTRRRVSERTVSSALGSTGSRHDVASISDQSVNTTVKGDTSNIGIQCVMPVIKTEINLDGDFYIQDEFRSRQLERSRMGVDRGIQCELMSPSRSQRMSLRAHSVASESETSEHHSSFSGESRCSHCGITFDDEVLFSIHIGCHSHTDPFICNVCGKQCGNKYGFYSHIMRGHHF